VPGGTVGPLRRKKLQGRRASYFPRLYYFSWPGDGIDTKRIGNRSSVVKQHTGSW